MNYLYTFLAALLIFSSCSDADDPPVIQDNKDVPEVATTDISTTAATSTLVRGEVVDAKNDSIFDKGICWSSSPNPTLDDMSASNRPGMGVFNELVTGLSQGTKYYVRAYATNSAGTGYGNAMEFTTKTESNTVALGNYYKGGIIFYIDGTGQHGLVSAPRDCGYSYWGCEGVNIPGTYSSIGTGKSNTQQILTYCKTPGIAADLCGDYTLGGYSDWFLPSKNELDLMHTNLSLKNIADFRLSVYWSSTQYSSNNAWRQLFNLNKNILHYDKDLTKASVRAIREF